MTGIRILRVIEYTYKDIETAIGDQERWTHAFSTPYMRMRSATTSMDTLGWAEEDNPVGVLNKVLAEQIIENQQAGFDERTSE